MGAAAACGGLSTCPHEVPRSEDRRRRRCRLRAGFEGGVGPQADPADAVLALAAAAGALAAAAAAPAAAVSAVLVVAAVVPATVAAVAAAPAVLQPAVAEGAGAHGAAPSRQLYGRWQRAGAAQWVQDLVLDASCLQGWDDVACAAAPASAAPPAARWREQPCRRRRRRWQQAASWAPLCGQTSRWWARNGWGQPLLAVQSLPLPPAAGLPCGGTGAAETP